MARHSLAPARSTQFNIQTFSSVALRISLAAVPVYFVLVTLPPSTARAGFHLWQISEAFSNADGTIQFIEMFDTNESENFIEGWLLETDSDGIQKTFQFPSSLAGSTLNKRVLIATPNFASLPGAVAPDFVLPDATISGPFFNPNASSISITFNGSLLATGTLTSTGGTFPKNGILSLGQSGTAENSPTNFQGQSGSVNLAGGPTGDYNGNHVVDAADYVNWRDRLNQTGLTPGSGPDGSSNGAVDLADFTFWRSKFGNAAGSASGVPEPTSTLVFGLIAFLAAAGRRRR